MITFTAEQQSPIDSNGKTIRINALAGTGKTTVLVGYTVKRPTMRVLNLCFNSSVQKEAEIRFPKNVESRTTHSMAYRAVGHSYKAKLMNNLRIQDIQRALGLGPQDYRLADQVQKLITEYTCSSVATLAEVLSTLGPKPHPDVLLAAERIWGIMCDPADLTVGQVHDGYLKLFQVTSPSFDQFDLILFDEAQDANPVTADIIFRQKKQLVLVGDKHQSIYQFRKSVNAMKNVPRSNIEDFYLTQSWRFGSAISDVANRLLAMKGEKVFLQGLGPTSYVGEVNRRERHTVLSRTNSGLFREAIRDKSASLFFVGGIEGYRFEQIEDAFHLSKGQVSRIKTRHLREFETFANMSAFAEETDDPESKMLINIVEKYSDRIPSLLSSVRARAVSHVDQANIILTTAHKSKGLEWSNVILADDFPSHEDLMETKEESPLAFEAEINLLYVASTRAKRHLQLPEELFPA